MKSRPPRQLLLALLGDNVLSTPDRPVRAAVFIAALEATGVAAPATRATLDRLARKGFLSRERRGREILFRLTGAGVSLLREGGDRVRNPHPFQRHGAGWTLVTFSIPEDRRALRHRIRSTLTWQGFAPIRDGLWLAPGEVDLAVRLEPLASEFPAGAVAAFHARELPGYSIAESVRAAWDLDRIRSEHVSFIDVWTDRAEASPSPLATRTMLVADWLAVLRADPGLPREYMDEPWPAEASAALYTSLRSELEEAADAEFEALVEGRALLTR